MSCNHEHEFEHEHEHEHESEHCCAHEHHHEHTHDHSHSHEHSHSCGCCGHDHGHSHEHGGEEDQGVMTYVRMGLSAVGLLASIFWLEGTWQLVVCIVAYLLAGFSVLREAVENISRGEIFDENFLMTVASIGAFCIGKYPEAVAVMLLYEIGEWLQDKAVGSSRASIKALVNVRPDHANLIKGDEVVTVKAETVSVNDIILVRPGERVPLDGEVIEGSSSVDTSALTGESMPQEWTVGSAALAGCVNQSGLLKIRVTKPFGESSVSRIMALVEDAQDNKAQPERFITRFARVYTPVVCGIAVLVAILPPLLGMGAWSTFIHKALAFLVISCPCALVISVPLSFFSGIGCASHNGILMKGSNYLELLSKAEIAAFDKTGTLTRGEFSVTSLACADGVTEAQLLEIAACCESQSTHPLAKSILKAYGKPVNGDRLTKIEELSGNGIRATLDGKTALAGKPELLDGITITTQPTGTTAVYVAYDGRYLGCIGLSDTLKPDTKAAIAALRKLGLHNLTMLSGDRQATADSIAKEVGLDNAWGQLLPEEKVTHLEDLRKLGSVVYAGDGINDAPVLAAADVGVAMGGLGSDAAMEAADVVIMTDELSRLPLAIRIARKTMAIAKQNIVFSIAIKILILALSLLMDIGLWLAVFADVGVCMLAILNSLRALHTK
mgnify:FL=1